MNSNYWGLEFVRQHNRGIVAYLWIDYDELKFDGYVLLEPDKYLEWKKLEGEGRKEPLAEYYESASLIIGESSMDEDIDNAGWGISTGTRKIFVNPIYAESLIPKLIEDVLMRHREEWIMAWLIFLCEQNDFWRKEHVKVRKIGNSYTIAVRGLEEGKEYHRLRSKYYENLLVIYLPHNP